MRRRMQAVVEGLGRWASLVAIAGLLLPGAPLQGAAVPQIAFQAVAGGMRERGRASPPASAYCAIAQILGARSFSALARRPPLPTPLPSFEAIARAEELDAPPWPPLELPPPAAYTPDEPFAAADRWRLVQQLGLVRENVLNPYAQNTLKGDRPIHGRDWFLDVSLESDTGLEIGRVPTARRAAAARVRRDHALRQELTAGLRLHKGSTVFRPPDWQFRALGVLRYGSALATRERRIDGDPGERPRDAHDFALRELYAERLLGAKSDRYDFDSVRVGLQPFSSDFRGFVYAGEEPGVRLFGNFDGNRWQYNLAWLRRTGRDRTSDLAELRLERDDLWVVNVYHQDFPVPGLQLQGTLLYDRGRERDRVPHGGSDAQRFAAALERAGGRARDVVYAGVSADGHLGRINLTGSLYRALGRVASQSPDLPAQQVRASFAALEASLDRDWYRLRVYGLYASGDGDPLDGTARGFAPVHEDARFAGLEESFLHRQGLPIEAGGAVLGGSGVLPQLRATRNRGFAGFAQPGVRIAGIGGSFDVLPELRISLNASRVDLDQPDALAPLLEGRRAGRHLGEDASIALLYRPLFIHNLVVRASLGALLPGDGARDLLGDSDRSLLASARLQLVLTY